MVAPHWDGNPNRYQPNPLDDRALVRDTDRAAYLAIATAIEAIEIGEDGIDRQTFYGLSGQTKRALGTAEKALRRAALDVVMFAPEPTADAQEGHA